jgi:molecular chaperone GrpE
MSNDEFEEKEATSASDANGPPLDDVIEDIVDALAEDQVTDPEVESEQEQEQEIEAVEEIVEELTVEQQLAQACDNNMRLLAEIDNLRKRSQRDMQQQLKYAAMPVISEMLSVIDDLHRTLEASQSGGDVDAFTGGVEIVVQSFTSVLEKYQCLAIKAEAGEAFDVKLHEAISLQVSDQFDANVILAVVQQGYQMHDRVIRPSQVIVSSGPAVDETVSGE